jgi:outer membrane protein TolC
MKKIVFLSLALSACTSVFAQDVDYNAIILPANAQNVSFEEKLVQLAWRNDPNNQMIIKQSSSAAIDTKIATWNWLNYIEVRSNINEFVLDPSSDPLGRANFYPKYNISFAVPLGTLGTNGLEVKKRRIAASIADDRVKAQKLAVRAEVLARYARYQLAEQKYKIQKETTDQSDVNYKYTEQRFKDGQEDLQMYNSILERNTNQKLRLAEVIAELKIAKYQVEEMIGTKLENVPQ